MQAGAAVTPIDFQGAPAWLTMPANSKFTSIAWHTGNGAALLSVDNASTDELKQAASTLELCARSLDIHP